MNKFFVDAGVAAGLGVALLVVILLDKLITRGAGPSSGNVKLEEPVIETSKTPPKPLRIAVTRTYEELIGIGKGQKELEKWDDMPRLLDTLGKGYQYTILEINDLFDAKKLAQYDVLFFTCGRGGTDTPITQNLHDFVVNGGTLYASDWRYSAVALAFPKYEDKSLQDNNVPAGDVVADVVDPGLREKLGTATVRLKFNLSMWKPAAFGTDRLTPEEKAQFKILMKGPYRRIARDAGSETRTVPLLVKFQVGKGVVIFTSFHNEKQNNAVEQELLKYLVFSAVTARTEAEITQTMLKGGFSPQKSNLLSASADNPSVTKTYHNKKTSDLRFVLGFENRGATLKLTVVSPNGKKYEKTGTSTITMDFSNAAPGDWEYTVTAEHVPFPDFPFTLTVGESAGKKE